MGYLIDTNIVSYILKRNATVEKKLRNANISGQDVFISCITYYEVKRGLLYANASRQLADFNQFYEKYEILFLDDLEIIENACKIQVDLKKRGHRLEDADILIAATAIARGLILVSNDSDLLRVEGLNLENWLSADI